MHIPQVFFAVLLLLQMTDASLIQLNRHRRSPNIQNIRLAGSGGSRNMGTVEIQGPNGTWGTICDDSFDMNDAIVVCRMLGFSSNRPTAYSNAHFGQGSGPVWLDDLGCTGTEGDLEQCASRGWGLHDCSHSEDAGVNCNFAIQNIRLAGNRSTSSRGRVEVLSSNGTWGTITDNNFDTLDAMVICRMLGFNTGQAIPYVKAYFGAGSGPIWIDNLGCLGNETHLDQCSNSVSYYSHSDDAGVACGIGVVIQNVRLVGRRGTHEGRVEILGPDETWGTLYYIDGYTANVICRMLGFETTGEVSVFSYAHFGQGSGPTYYIQNYGCTGQETNITNCATSNVIANYYSHDNDVGVSCNKEHDIRLVDGNSELDGRVEVYHNGVWGTVCNNGFDSRDAEVICYMLGYDTGSIQIYTWSHYSSGTGQIWLDNLSCNGTESRLDDCLSLIWGTNSCSHSQDVGVDCRQSVRLYGGRYPSEGYVQIGNDWNTICGYNFGSSEAQAVCHSLGFSTTYWVPTYYSVYNSVSASKTTIKCIHGTESNLAECKQGTNTVCSSYNAPYVNCTGSLNGGLVGGAHSWEGKLQIRNNRVCTDVWTDKEATLFCQLISSNMKGEVYGRVIRNTAFDQQPGSFVFLSTHCNGGLPFCISEVNNTESCPYTDIAMSCAHYERDSQHSVRLVNGQAEYEGRVEIKVNDTWYTLCDSGWDQYDAIVVCRSLGYWVSSSTAYSDAWFGQGSVPSSYVYPSCNTAEQSIFECQTSYFWGYTACGHSDDAGVRCTPETLGRDKIRLAYGPGPWKGKLEVFYNNRWGGICMTSWTQRNTDVVCRMMMYHSARPTHYVFNGTSTTILIGDVQCRGNETDIGICKAFLDKANCTDDVVGIDCSVGIQARLTGGNSSMGYAQLQENGSWKQICSSGWNNEEAAVLCRTLGFTIAVARTDANVSNGILTSEFLSVDCVGWEDHIDQCSMQNVSSVCSPASVSCLDCYYEYTHNTGTLASPNYPSYYPPNWSCLYIIRPHGPSRSGFYTLRFTQMYLNNQGDQVEVRDGFPGLGLYSWKGYLYSYGVLAPIIAKEFSVHFHSDSSGEYQGFYAQWSPLAIDDALTAGCTSSGWNIKINTTIAKMLDPAANPANIYMNMRSCTGKTVDDTLQFLHAYTDCGTNRQISSSEIIYTNHIIQPLIDPSFPNMVFQHLWRVETRCSMPVTANNGINIYPTEGSSGSVIDNGYHNLSTTTQANLLFYFYTDPGFHNEIKGNLYVPFGHELYVKVVYDSRDTNVKMKLDTCTIQDQYSQNQMFTLIRDGCPTNSMVHLISAENHEARFSYRVFEFQDSNHWLTLNCNANFCIYYDGSHRCTPGCTTKRAMDPEQESFTTVTHEVQSGRMILQMEAPDAILSEDTKNGPIKLGSHYSLGEQPKP